MSQPLPTATRTPERPAGSDPRPLLQRAADQAVGLVGAVRPGEQDLPTPCTDYDVRALCGHVLTVLRRIELVARGGSPFDVPQVVRDVPDADLSRAAAADRDRMVATWADDAVLDRVLTLPWGTLPGRAAALAYAQELTVHAWDLATATGRGAVLDPGLAAAVLPLARQFVPAEPRGGPVPFGPVVDFPGEDAGEDAGDAYAELVAWLGRDPWWQPRG